MFFEAPLDARELEILGSDVQVNENLLNLLENHFLCIRIYYYNVCDEVKIIFVTHMYNCKSYGQRQ